MKRKNRHEHEERERERERFRFRCGRRFDTAKPWRESGETATLDDSGFGTMIGAFIVIVEFRRSPGLCIVRTIYAENETLILLERNLKLRERERELKTLILELRLAENENCDVIEIVERMVA